MTATTPKKPFTCLVAPAPVTAQLAPTLDSPRNSRIGLHRHTGPEITITPAPTCNAIPTAQLTLAPDLCCGPPTAKSP